MSGGFLLRLGALPGPGKIHSIAALLQFEHGCLLSHFTFRFLHVMQDLELRPFEEGESDDFRGWADCSLVEALESFLINPLVEPLVGPLENPLGCGSTGDAISVGDAPKSDMAGMTVKNSW